MPLLDVVCPAGVREGDLLAVALEDGTRFEVALPPDVSEGDVFQVTLEDGERAVHAPPAGLRVIAAELASAKAIAAEFFGGEPARIEESEVLAAALRSVLGALDYGDLDDLIDGGCAAFANYAEGGEQRLEWTEMHARYVTLVEQIIKDHLEELETTAEEVVEYARVYGTGDATTERLLARLIALGDYQSFAAMMREAHEHGPMGV